MRWGVAALAALGLFLVACDDEPTQLDDGEPGTATEAEDRDEGADSHTTARGDGVEVVTSVFALAALAERLAPGANVELLGARGQDPHDLGLSPGERRAIEDADVVVHMGDIGFQPQVAQAVRDTTAEVVSVADVVGEDELVHFDRDNADHSDADPGDTDPGDADPGDADPGDHGTTDPHVWLAPRLMTEVATAIGQAFAAADADHGEAYDESAAALADELAAAEDAIDERLSDCAHPRAVVGHEAWAYLLEPRGLQQVGISRASGHGEASPQRLAELADLIEAEGIPGVFAEPVEGRENAEALAAEADVELFEVDPLGVPADVDAWLERGYLELLMDQVDRFAEGMQCRA